jgi:GNAT superfamily N-acetyltransferase
MSEDEFLPLFRQCKDAVFEDFYSYSLKDLLEGDALEKVETFKKEMDDVYKLYIGAFDENGKFVGWTWGRQDYDASFCMINSAVLNQYRRHGIYSALLKKCIELATLKGFQIVYSRHHVTNNAVIIPKLKAGFTISKMELDDRFGVLVHLHYYTNPVRRKIMSYRSGFSKPDADVKKVL